MHICLSICLSSYLLFIYMYVFSFTIKTQYSFKIYHSFNNSYQVDNLCLGHLWLKSVLEYDNSPWSAVRTAWQPDPFGHSSTAAYLFRMSGFDFYGFGRGETEVCAFCVLGKQLLCN